MTQPSIDSYFHTRKRLVAEDLSGVRNKVLALDTNNPLVRCTEHSLKLFAKNCEKTKPDFSSGNNGISEEKHSDNNQVKSMQPSFDNIKVLSQSTLPKKLMSSCHNKPSKNFCLAGAQNKEEVIKDKAFHLDPFIKEDNAKVVASIITSEQNNLKCKQNRENITEVVDTSLKSKDTSLCCIKKIVRKPRKSEFNALMMNLKKGLSKLDEMEYKRLALTELKKSDLKESKSTEAYVTARSQKPFLNSYKIYEDAVSPKKNECAVRKLLLSPTKKSVPAYQRHHAIAKDGKSTLVLPYNYKCLAEIFRCVDDVIGMLYNRKETITFNKLKPAVQEMLRKNFTESHLAQIKTVYPEALIFSQDKIRNFGSTSKQDKYELVITPNLKLNTDVSSIKVENTTKSVTDITMNPQIKLTRQREFYNCLLEKVMIKHEEFLATLDPPLRISRDALKTWHPEFKIEEIADIEKSELPQPPNIEMFASAKDVLSNVRKMFHCNPRMERALERLEESKAKGISSTQNLNIAKSNIQIKPEFGIKSSEPKSKFSQTEPPVGKLLNPALKGIPQFLLEKVKARQAAKALDAMTRSSVEDKETLKLKRLPEIARHARNLFVTEKKGVLLLEIVLNKLKNSYRANLNQKELEEHLKLLSEQIPGWIVFHDIRKKGVYIKLCKDYDMSKVLKKLERLILEKTKSRA